jgi:DNA-binding NtrC family response regulator
VETTSDLSNVKILVIEDGEELTAIWRSLFRREGISARFCNSGQAALATIENDYAPDIVMTDYYLPDTTGLELVNEIRKRAGTAKFLMVSGNHDDAFVKSVEEKDLPLVFKPVRFQDLLSKLKDLSKKGSRPNSQDHH